jgi:signal transduction histidine kinase/CheY-like chemotaxis protein
MEDVLRIITDEAREIIGAHQSVSSVSRNREWAQAITAVSLSDKCAAWRAYDEKPDGSGIYALVCETNRPLRLTRPALEAHPRWRGFGAHAGKHPPLNGWLAVPFIGSKGQNLGLIQLSDKYEGEFTEEDEDILIQLAHMAAYVIENSHLYDELRQADRTKDEFLALVSHEIRNPLNAILGWTQLARAAKSNEALISRALETIERNTLIQAKLIEDLLDVSRILTGKLKVDKSPVEIAPVIQASLDAARPDARAKSINLRDTIDYSTGVVIGDSDRLQQIVLNLLNNAIKFTPEGGRVELRLERIEEPAGRPCAQLTVSDTGVGMSDEFLPYVFDRFRQADSSTTKMQAGLGLGLAIVRHMVELHGGIVEAKSAGKNQGSTFIVKLPLAESSQSFPGLKTPLAQRGHIPPAIERNSLQGLYVLMVDDHLDTRVSLAIGLKSYGAEIEACSSVAEAMVALQRRLPDIILSDIAMPDEDGYALIKKVRAMEPNRGGRIPAIALTGYAGDESRQQLLAAGFHIHIPKPTDIPSLVKRILDAIESTRMSKGIVSRQPDQNLPSNS